MIRLLMNAGRLRAVTLLREVSRYLLLRRNFFASNIKRIGLLDEVFAWRVVEVDPFLIYIKWHFLCI